MKRDEVDLQDDLWNTQHIATYYRQTRKHITDKVVKRPDFPAPEIDTSERNRWWSAAKVKAHAQGAKV